MKKKKIIIPTIVLLIIIGIVIFFVLRIKINKSEALDIAYKHIGLTEVEVPYRKIKRDLEDNCYEIELNDRTYKYEIEIDMTTGAVLNYEKELVNKVPEQNNNVDKDLTNDNNVNANENNNEINKTNKITKEQATSIALDRVNANKEDAIIKEIKLDYDNGREIYEIEFIYNNREYEYEIDTTTGEILSMKIDR